MQYLSSHLVENGAIAIIGDGSFWTGNEPCQIKTKEVIQEFLGPDRKAGGGKNYVTSPDPYDVVLKRNGYINIDVCNIPITRHWSLDSIIGYLYSTSFSAYYLYGGQNIKFERRLRNELSRINNNSPEFIENIKFVVQSAEYQQS